MSQYYFPIIEEALLREGLPIELRALPIIESALSADGRIADGRRRAVAVHAHDGERATAWRSTRWSTNAATRTAPRRPPAAILKDLYAIYNDWTLAIAAYNCGPGNVNKAIARSGGKTFWEIYDYLPRETRGYVPAFIGATYAYAYHRQHGIEPTGA